MWQPGPGGPPSQAMAMGADVQINMQQYTPDQWQVMQQQNWQQWAQWQQQYSQWQNQPFIPPIPPGAPVMHLAPPPPVNNPVLPPLPPEQPPPLPAQPPPPHQNDQPLYEMPKPQNKSSQYSKAPVAENQGSFNFHQPPPNYQNQQEQTSNQAIISHNKSAIAQWQTNVPPPHKVYVAPIPPPKAEEELSEEEKQFDIQFKKWQEEFEKWKEQNANHPDKKAYREYEMKFEACRAQLLDRRKQMTLKRLGLSNNVAQDTETLNAGDSQHVELFPAVDKSKGIPGLDLVDDANRPETTACQSNNKPEPIAYRNEPDSFEQNQHKNVQNQQINLNQDNTNNYQGNPRNYSKDDGNGYNQDEPKNYNQNSSDNFNQDNYNNYNRGDSNCYNEYDYNDHGNDYDYEQENECMELGQDERYNCSNNQDIYGSEDHDEKQYNNPPDQFNYNQNDQNFQQNQEHLQRGNKNFQNNILPMQTKSSLPSLLSLDVTRPLENMSMPFNDRTSDAPKMHQQKPQFQSLMDKRGANMNQIRPNMTQIRANMNQIRPNMNQIRPNMNQIISNMNQNRPNMNQNMTNMNHNVTNRNQNRPNINQIRSNMDQNSMSINQMKPNVNQMGQSTNQSRPNMSQNEVNNNPRNIAPGNLNIRSLNVGVPGGYTNLPLLKPGTPNVGHGSLLNLKPGPPSVNQMRSLLNQPMAHSLHNETGSFKDPGQGNPIFSDHAGLIPPPEQTLQEKWVADPTVESEILINYNHGALKEGVKDFIEAEQSFVYDHKSKETEKRGALEEWNMFSALRGAQIIDYQNKSANPANDFRMKRQNPSKFSNRDTLEYPEKRICFEDDRGRYFDDRVYHGEKGAEYLDEQRSIIERHSRERSRLPVEKITPRRSRERFSSDRSHYKEERGRYPEERSRGPEERSRYQEERSRYPEERSRYAEDRSRYPEDRPRHPEDRSRYPEDRSRYPEDRSRYADERRRYPDDRRSRRSPERSRFSIEREKLLGPEDSHGSSRTRNRENRQSNRNRSKSKSVERISISSKEDEDEVTIVEPQRAMAGNLVTIEDILEEPGREIRPPKIVIIIRGPPGGGKSHIAKLIKEKEIEKGGAAPKILSIDDYFIQEELVDTKDPNTGVVTNQPPTLKYTYDESLENTYMNSLKRAFNRTVTSGYYDFIIVEAVFDQLKSYAQLHNFAKQNGFQVYVVQTELDPQTCFSRNIHDRTLEDIEIIASRWFPTPKSHITLDCNSLIEDIQVVQMEDVVHEEEQEETEAQEGGDQQVEPHVQVSKWEQMDDTDKLARLDGISKPLRPSQISMDEYLQLDDWEPINSKPGKKTVRWADIEERRKQDKMRAIGFVVGKTDWSRMTDPTQGSSALTQTKYIERVNNKKY